MIIPAKKLFSSSDDDLKMAIMNWESYPPSSLIISYAILKKRQIPLEEIASHLEGIRRSLRGDLDDVLMKFYAKWNVSSIEEYEEKLNSGELVKAKVNEKGESVEEKSSLIIRVSFLIVASWMLWVLGIFIIPISTAPVLVIWLLFNFLFHICKAMIEYQERIIDKLEKLNNE